MHHRLFLFFTLLLSTLAFAQEPLSTTPPTPAEQAPYLNLVDGFQACLQSGKLIALKNVNIQHEHVDNFIASECRGAGAKKLFDALLHFIGDEGYVCDAGVERERYNCWLDDWLIFGNATTCSSDFHGGFSCTIRLDSVFKKDFSKTLTDGIIMRQTIERSKLQDK